MNLAILGFGSVQASEMSTLKIAPAWRKATRNMILSAAAVERAKPAGVSFEGAVVGLVLHSGSGELDTSADFLTTLDQQKMARPVLFQNSLHNATTGFLSIAFAITGPTMTVSAGSEDAVLLAQTLLDEGACDFCWVVSCEVHKKLADMAELSLQEGASAILLTLDESASRWKIQPKARVSTLEVARVPLKNERLQAPPLVSNERDFLNQWVEALKISPRSEGTSCPTVAGHRVTLAWA